MWHLKRNAAVSVALLAATPIPVMAAEQVASPAVGSCCLGGDHGQEAQSTGLGQSQPAAMDLSLDPSWRVYAFQRDGMEYFQVNDLTGRVLLIVGKVGDNFWLLPAGEESVGGVLPPRAISMHQGATASRVFENAEFSLVRFWANNRAVWAVETSTLPR